jgi:hypothetical protein
MELADSARIGIQLKPQGAMRRCDHRPLLDSIGEMHPHTGWLCSYGGPDEGDEASARRERERHLKRQGAMRQASAELLDRAGKQARCSHAKRDARPRLCAVAKALRDADGGGIGDRRFD